MIKITLITLEATGLLKTKLLTININLILRRIVKKKKNLLSLMSLVLSILFKPTTLIHLICLILVAWATRIYYIL